MSAFVSSPSVTAAITAATSPHRGPRRFAVIGAGAAGLCAAKFLVQRGFEDVTIFEIGTQIGGLWKYQNDNDRSAAYRTLHINTAKYVTQFSDFAFNDTVQMFPDHRDMHAYLVSYAEHFDLVRRIRFRSRVLQVRPTAPLDSAQQHWEVEIEGGVREPFDCVIVASGHLSVPMHVPEYRDAFEGEYLHSHDYRQPEPFVSKKICVVGVGNSACDIASDVCSTSPLTVMVARSGVMIGPKLIFGRPFTDVTFQLYKNWIPDWLRRRTITFLVRMIQGRMTDLGFKPLTERAHPTTSAMVVQHITYRRIIVKQGIERIEGHRIFFTDGTSDEFDTMIAATGYLIDLPFVPPEVAQVKNNQVDLYKRMCAPGWNGLYFVGLLNSTSHALNDIFEQQAKWICAVEQGKISLPSMATMSADIETKKQYIRRHFRDSPRHTIEEESLRYLAELERQRKAGRRERSSPTNAEAGASR